MKKITLSLIIAFIICAFAISVHAESVYRDTLVTSNDDVSINFEIKDNLLTVSGMVDDEECQYLIINIDASYVLPVSSEMKFTTRIDLSKIESPRATIGIFLGKNLTDAFKSVFYGDDIVLEKNEDTFSFIFEGEVLNNNTEWLAGWVSEKDHLDTNQPAAVKTVTSNVVSKLKTDYEKARAIHHWVSDNIYYDENYALKTTNYTPLTPLEVLKERRSVCEGYSNLTVAMLNSAGIPAFVVKGYALGVDAARSWKDAGEALSTPNHAWVEAFVDGKWISMDPTWDSYNKTFMNEKTTEENPMHRYFDITPEMLSLKHLILERPLTFGKDGISFWAENEAKSAYEEGLILKTTLNSMKSNISRKEFCHLIVNMLTVKYSKTAEELLHEKGLELDFSVFVDTADEYVLTANALGIVNGKGDNMFDPEGYITRQEAATMLYRTAKAIGVTAPNSEKLTFTDEEEFAEWGKEGIFFVSASLSDKGTRVMGGVEDGKFAPSGFYTKEQSVLTVYRIFHTY